MSKDKPKECCNSTCKNIFYVPNYKLHLPLICERCQKKYKTSNSITYNKGINTIAFI